jgi:fatty-acid desaturase
MTRYLKWAKSTAQYNYWFAFAHGICLLVGLVYLTSLEFLYAYLVSTFVVSFGAAYGIHRLIIHKVSNPHPLVRKAAVLVSVLSNTSSPVLWAGSHYSHHRNADDITKDPHTPKHGKKVLFGYYDPAALSADSKFTRTSLKAVIADPFNKWIHQYYYLILGTYLIECLVLGGVKGLLIFGLVPSSISFYSLMALNYFGHGKVPGSYTNHDTKDESRNVWWLFPFLLGENWHNNHHHSPSARTTKDKWWEVDPTYLWIWLFDDTLWTQRRYRFNRIKLKLRNMVSRRSRDPYIY